MNYEPFKDAKEIEDITSAWQAGVDFERRLCIKICEEYAEQALSRSSETGDYQYAKSVGAQSCADAIKALG